MWEWLVEEVCWCVGVAGEGGNVGVWEWLVEVVGV